MLIWINGAFGAGNTQTAHEVQRLAADAHAADRYQLRRIAVGIRHIRI